MPKSKKKLKNPASGKTDPIKIHALKRMRERIDPNAQMKDLLGIAIAIKSSNGRTFVSSTSNAFTIHRVIYKGEPIKAVYDKTRGLVKTVMKFNEF